MKGWRAFITITVLALVGTVQSVQAEPYKRSLYKHWIDADRDCQDTREEVLIAESTITVTLDKRGCRVVKGRWFDPYTGKTITKPKSLDIDHFVPLKEVHRSGGNRWGKQRRQDYANDLTSPDTLIAVSAAANRSKGDKDPAKWMPPNKAFHCDYVRTWVAVKTRWQLTMDAQEQAKINSVLATCPAVMPFPLQPLMDGLRLLVPGGN